MGAYLPDRFFWARSNDDDETPPVVVDAPPATPGEARH
jgi:hydroxymethylpyrimidine/phosphomethylpyrimidine kinase